MDETTRTEELSRRQAQEVTSAGEGMKQGWKNFGHGISQGFKGVVVRCAKLRVDSYI